MQYPCLPVPSTSLGLLIPDLSLFAPTGLGGESTLQLESGRGVFGFVEGDFATCSLLGMHEACMRFPT